MDRDAWWWVLVIDAIVLAGCVTSNQVLCPDGTFCADGTACAAVAPPTYACVADVQYAACGGIADGEACAFEIGERTAVGTCFGGACIEQRCGDNLVDKKEVCDDGGQTSGDDCSADCLSAEICGNGIVDVGEECDVGVVGLSGDGCTSNCLSEYPMWRDVQLAGPPVRFAHQMAADPLGGVVIFGGASVDVLGVGELSTKIARPSFDDMWRWDGVSWSRIVPARPLPALTSAAVAYDATKRQVLVFGGYQPDVTSSTLWAWDGVGWSPRSGTGPTARAEASLACDDGACVLFGGLDSTTESALKDLWTWDGVQWSSVMPPQPYPLARGRALMTLLPGATRIVLHGGISAGGTYLRDTWELALTPVVEWTRTNPPPPGNMPVGPASERMIGDQFGASLVAIPPTGVPVWRYAGTWADDPVPITVPPLATSVAAARDADRNVLVITSGGAVVELAGSSWSTPTAQVALPVGPTPAAYDASSGRVIAIMASQGSMGLTTRTWAWDGDTWRLLVQVGTPATSATLIHDVACDQVVAYGARTTAVLKYMPGHTGAWTVEPPPPSQLATATAQAMAYDERRDVVVLVGGFDASSIIVTEDVWEWGRAPGQLCNEKVWTRRAVTTGPSRRHGATLTYDPIRQRVLLFGGRGVIGEELDDLWEWDGATWSELTTTPRPPKRANHGATYDHRLGRLVIFGGRSIAALRNDLWAFDSTPAGGTWQLITSVLSPSARTDVTLTRDRTGKIMAIGGYTFGPAAGTFRFGFEQIVERREQCRDANVDEDGDGLKGCDDPDCRSRCAPQCPVAVEFASCTGPRCGDGTCSLVEDSYICPTDCAPP